MLVVRSLHNTQFGDVFLIGEAIQSWSMVNLKVATASFRDSSGIIIMSYVKASQILSLLVLYSDFIINVKGNPGKVKRQKIG